MKIIMVAGGSGGHIYPALSLARALKEKGHEISFIGSDSRMEKDAIPEAGFPFTGLKMEITGSGLIQNLKSFTSLFFAYFKCKNLVKDADMVIGFGNYISVPVILAGKRLKKKTVIHEQNSFVGRANRFLDQKVDLIICCYKENLKQFKNKNIAVLGNPQESIAAKVEKDESLISEIGLDKNKKTVLIFYGSLGSETLFNITSDLIKSKPDYQIVYACGSRYIDSSKDLNSEKVKVVEKLDGVKWMKVADVLVSRAGATTLAEICASGIASILIPSPFVPNNHQYYNAKALSDNEAAILIEEKDLSVEILNENIEKLLNDEELNSTFRKNALALANPNAIYDSIERLENL